jgi:hypothetical protein
MSVLFWDAGMATKRSMGTLGEADLRGKKVFVHANLNVPLDDAQKIRRKKRKILVALRHLHLLRPIPPAPGPQGKRLHVTLISDSCNSIQISHQGLSRLQFGCFAPPIECP